MRLPLLAAALLAGAHGVAVSELKQRLQHVSTTLVRHDARQALGKPLKQTLRRVSTFYRVAPTRANMLSGAAIFAVGDLLAQQIERRSGTSRSADANPVCVQRIASSASLGSVWNGVCSPQVYRFAESVLPGKAMRSILLKTAMTVGFLSTCGNYCNLLARKLLAGEQVAAAVAAINEGMGEVVAADLKVWPVWDIVQFACVPPTYRPVLTAAVCCGWSTYISMVAMRDVR